MAVFFLISVAASRADAQTDGTLALGWEAGAMLPSDTSASGGNDLGIVWRFGRDETGWGWHWGLNWYETTLTRQVGGTRVELGDLHVRPITMGYGFTYVAGRTAIIADMLGGFAFTSMSMSPAARDSYQRIGQNGARLDAGMTWIARPEVLVWYDLSKNFGLVFNVGYMFARPTLTISTSAGQDVRRIDADMLMLQVGLAYAVF